ncbi:MAG TPA: protein kinase [Vicinamibacteria bacterium]|nr:protein kinase [Vicinamibacteria bacterium]
MAPSVGTRLGPFEILGTAGAGGMGEVYRARDTRLDRTVALKILPGHLSDDPVSLERFEREARAISRFNHPNICSLYDVDQEDGVAYLVLEYLEGETLAARLKRGPLSLTELLRIGREVASALHTAHLHGIVHRDLKPGNVMLTRSGAKLLDFGLAKHAGESVPEGVDVSDASVSPTRSQPLTKEGTVVGTVPYMAPEQFEGKDADARTDIFALGLMLYEMAAGTHPFEGRSPAGWIAAILKEEPRALSERAPTVPQAFDRIVRSCLMKDPKERWQSAHDVRIQLDWLEHHVEPAVASSSRSKKLSRREWILIGVVLSLLSVAGVVGLGSNRRDRELAPPVRASLLPPPGVAFEHDDFAISPDGTRVAFVALDAAQKYSLWVRTLSGVGAQQLAGAEDAMLPFWAPDSRRIGFFTRAGKLKTIDLATGAVRELCDAQFGRGGSWSRDEVIVFSPATAGPLLRISATGGEPVPATSIPPGDRGHAHRWPHFLPDGRHFLFFLDWSAPGNRLLSGIYVGSLDAEEPKLVSSGITGNVSYAAGRLLFVQDRRLMALPFDPVRLEPTGLPAPIGEQELEKDLAFSRSGFSVSDTGVLVFQSAADNPARLEWFDAEGNEMAVIPAMRYRDPRLSPGGRRLAVTSDDSGNGKRVIRIFDLDRGVSSRLTEGGIEEMPVWSADGSRIVYVSFDGESYELNEVPADGSRPPHSLIHGGKMIPNDRARDDRLIFMSFDKGPPELAVLSPSDGVVTTMGPGAEAQLSPDDNWIAFLNPGRIYAEIIVQPFPGPGARLQISNGGGGQPRWSHDGRTIYYVTPERKLMAVTFDPERQSAEAPRELFQTRIVSPNFVLFQYDVAADGRFLINSLPSENASPLTLVTSWPSQLEP